MAAVVQPILGYFGLQNLCIDPTAPAAVVCSHCTCLPSQNSFLRMTPPIEIVPMSKRQSCGFLLSLNPLQERSVCLEEEVLWEAQCRDALDRIRAIERAKTSMIHFEHPCAGCMARISNKIQPGGC